MKKFKTPEVEVFKVVTEVITGGDGEETSNAYGGPYEE